MGNSVTSQQLKSVAESLQSSVANILSQNSSTISNVVDVSQTINIIVKGTLKCTDGLQIDQNTAANMKYITKVTTQTTNDLKQMLESEITNKASQTSQIIRGFLSNLGTSSNDSVGLEIISRMTQLINTAVTTQNITRSVNQTLIAQNQNITIDTGGYLESKDCKFNQNTVIDMSANNVINNLISTIVDDKVIGRITNDAKQSLVKKEQGLNDLLSALILPLILVICVLIIGFALFSKEGLKRLTDPKFIGVVVALISGGLLFAWKFTLWPFKAKKQFWGCEKKSDGSNTAGCIQFYNSTDGPFDSEETCKNSGTCNQFWGCEKDTNSIYTGKCIQYNNALDGPYYTQDDCENKVRNQEACTVVYGCKQDSNGFNIQPGECSNYNVDNPNKPKQTFNQKNDCDPTLCKQYWYCQSKKNKTCQQTSDPQSFSEDEIYNDKNTCQNVCK